MADRAGGRTDGGRRPRPRWRPGTPRRWAVVAAATLLAVATAACTPAPTAPPEIVGVPIVGLRLTAFAGTWDGSPGSLTFTWVSCAAADPDDCAERRSGPDPTYVVAAADEGRRLRVTVAATNGAGTTTADSAATAVVRLGDGDGWRAWSTDPDGDRALAVLDPAAEPSTVELVVDPADRHQTWLGTGAALTDSAASLLPAATGDGESGDGDLAGALFDPDDPGGTRLDLLRLPLSATDFSPRGWTWQDDPAGPVAPPAEPQAALALLDDLVARNPALEVVGASWSAPAWMKDSGQLNGGGLAPGREDEYADLLVAQAAALRDAGVPLRAVSLGNEPGHSSSTYPTMTMTDAQMTALATDVGGRLDGEGVELWALDHNWSDRGRLDTLLAGAPGAFDAAAFHCYAGDPSAMGGVPLPTVLTECTGGQWDPSWASTFRWQARNLVVEPVAHGSTGLLLWNLALDPAGGPHVGGCGNCRGVVTVDPATGGWSPEPEFFLLAHLGRAAVPGATRISVTGPAGAGAGAGADVPAVAFAHPDGTIGVFGHNASGERQVVDVTFAGRPGHAARVAIAPGALFSLHGPPVEP